MTTTLEDWAMTCPPRIASRPSVRRDGSRLMHLPLVGGAPEDGVFGDLPDFFSRVISLWSTTPGSWRRGSARAGPREGGRAAPPGARTWSVRCLAKPARRLKSGRSSGRGPWHRRDLGASGRRRCADGSDRLTPRRSWRSRASCRFRPTWAGLPTSDTERYQTVYAGPLVLGGTYGGAALHRRTARDAPTPGVPVRVGHLRGTRNLPPAS